MKTNEPVIWIDAAKMLAATRGIDAALVGETINLLMTAETIKRELTGDAAHFAIHLLKVGAVSFVDPDGEAKS